MSDIEDAKQVGKQTVAELEARAVELARIARTHRMGTDEATAAESRALVAFRAFHAERDRQHAPASGSKG